MGKLNIFIDGSWLFRVCQPEGSLSSKTESSDRGFQLDFGKLSSSILKHIQKSAPDCKDLGDRYIATSVFNLPDDFENWHLRNSDISESDIQKTQRNVFMRGKIVENAIRAGFRDDAVYRPAMKPYIIKKLVEKSYQEKQVDASVVALLVRSAITNPSDYHVVITGDSDIIPAIQMAYPEFSENVVIATTHPDELRAEHRQTSFSFNSVEFKLPPYYLQEHIQEILFGNHVYICGECAKVFARSALIPTNRRPYCTTCLSSRT